MWFIEKDDLEMSYRRGYERGAIETFHAVEQCLDAKTRGIVRDWIEKDIHGWRLKAMLAHPPTWRLSSLNIPNQA
jgi:hypothetical protein